MDRLISLEPSNLLAIRIEPGQKCYGVLTLRNVMYTMPVAFRIQAMNKTRYTIKPQSGIISPLATLTIEITYHLPPGSFLPDTFPHCEDAFLLHSVVVPGASIKDPTSNFDAVPPDWFTAKKKQVFIDSGIKIMFVGSQVLAQLVADGAMDEIREVLEHVERQSRSGSTPLEAAAGAGEALIVELLLARRASAERSESSTWGPIHLAAGGGHLEVLRLLLLKGANVDALTKDARKGEVRTILKLIENGAAINGRDQHGWTALHRAAFKGKIDAVRALLDKGIDIDAKDEDGYTALHCAVESGHADVIELLVKKGADVEARTNKGVTALQIAESLHYVGITRVLIHSGAAKDGVMQVAAPVHLPFGKSMSGTEVEKAIKKRPPRARALKGSFDRSMALAVL
ncbi:hypothetical protein GH714_004581 [Hevea brasiliensis]|uniref:MSP domain-containing protein n=1 Tax=Hevea brasiliensis TaxID=3981 RepID=A0A6A6KL18_HEVBR|nr:hypothetical protein GH714_004581 [Hevea brasiliensis]